MRAPPPAAKKWGARGGSPLPPRKGRGRTFESCRAHGFLSSRPGSRAGGSRTERRRGGSASVASDNPLSKSFRPRMCTAGAMTSRSSSTRPSSSSDWVRAMLPCTPISPPDRCFSSVMNSARPPSTTVVFAQASRRRRGHHELVDAIDEAREWLDVTGWPELGPVVVGPASEEHGVLGRNDAAKVLPHHLVELGDEFVGLLCHAIDR